MSFQIFDTGKPIEKLSGVITSLITTQTSESVLLTVLSKTHGVMQYHTELDCVSVGASRGLLTTSVLRKLLNNNNFDALFNQ